MDNGYSRDARMIEEKLRRLDADVSKVEGLVERGVQRIETKIEVGAQERALLMTRMDVVEDELRLIGRAIATTIGGILMWLARVFS
jgi:hypothetical protein